MQLHTSSTEPRRRSSPIPACPTCRAPLVAALASEFVDTGEIHHHWACDDCGQAFSTTVTIRH